MKEIKVPQLDVNDETVLLVEWKFSDGEYVEEGTELCVIETTKVAHSLTAKHSGYLRIKIDMGEEASTREALGWIAESKDEMPDESNAPETAAPSRPITAKARKLAEAHGIDISTVPLTGGIIKEKDIRARIQPDSKQSESLPLPSDVRPDQVSDPISLSRSQRMIKDKMLESINSNASAFISMNIRVDQLTPILEKATKTAGIAVRLGDILVYAVARALTKYPSLNAFYWENQIIPYRNINVGVAMDFDDNLIVPVIPDTDKKSLTEIAEQSAIFQMEMVKQSLSPNAVAGGTFTITNLGASGIHAFAPIINGRQAGILGIGAPESKVELVDGKLNAIQTLALGFTYDHRINNGMRATKFLNEIKSNLKEELYG